MMPRPPKQQAELKLWRCPKCEEQISALAIEVVHRCIKNRNRYTQWEQVA